MKQMLKCFGLILICLANPLTVNAAEKDAYYVVRKINGGSCTTSKGIGVQPGWERCSGPYDSESAAKDWLSKNEEPDSTCKKEKCNYKP